VDVKGDNIEMQMSGDNEENLGYMLMGALNEDGFKWHSKAAS
jgi:hypothetical protein